MQRGSRIAFCLCEAVLRSMVARVCAPAEELPERRNACSSGVLLAARLVGRLVVVVGQTLERVGCYEGEGLGCVCAVVGQVVERRTEVRFV